MRFALGILAGLLSVAPPAAATTGRYSRPYDAAATSVRCAKCTLPTRIFHTPFGTTPVEAPRYPGAVTVRHFNFEPDEDLDYDFQPDGWTRLTGPDLPAYPRTVIDSPETHANAAGRPAHAGAASLRFDTSGGQASLQSPLIPVDSRHSYILEGAVRIEGLAGTTAFVAIALVDADRQVVEEHETPPFGAIMSGTAVRSHRDAGISPVVTSGSGTGISPVVTIGSGTGVSPVTGADGWHTWRLGPFTPQHPEVRAAVVTLHVRRGDRIDTTARAWFDDLWLGRLPRITLETAGFHNLYAHGEAIEVHCTIDGIDRGPCELGCELVDVEGTPGAATRRSVPAGPALRDATPGVQPGDESTSLDWSIPAPLPGYYELRAVLTSGEGAMLSQSLSLAVLAHLRSTPSSRSRASEPAEAHALAVPGGIQFGWSAPRGIAPLAPPDFAEIAAQAGVRWLKHPVWLTDESRAASLGNQHQQAPTRDSQLATRDSQLSTLFARLADHNIRVVGLLAGDDLRSPASHTRSPASPLPAADLLLPPEQWCPALEPVLARHALAVRWWQLGGDHDATFAGLADLDARLTAIRAQFDRVAPRARIGIAWDPNLPLPTAGPDFLSLPLTPLSQNEPTREVSLPLDSRLSSLNSQPSTLNSQLWLTLTPLPADSHTLADRAAEFARRMVAAAASGAGVVFAADVFDPQTGLFHSDGSPTELFVAWCTVARALDGAHYLGRLPLTGGSTGAVFQRGDEAIVVLWNDLPAAEYLNLGAPLTVIDFWGRPVQASNAASPSSLDSGLSSHDGPPTLNPQLSTFAIGRTPILALGGRAEIARWQLVARFERGRAPSRLGAHADAIAFQNTFDRAVSGRARLVMPTGWNVSPEAIEFALAAGESFQRPLSITFPPHAELGAATVLIEFTIEADRRYEFAVPLEYCLGTGEVEASLTARLTPEGDLEVEQRLTNATAPLEELTFRCNLYVPGRRRLQSLVTRLRHGTDVEFYRLPNAADLAGQTIWLRAEQVGGRRILNVRALVPPAT